MSQNREIFCQCDTRLQAEARVQDSRFVGEGSEQDTFDAFEAWQRLSRDSAAGKLWDIDLYILQEARDGIADQLRLIGDRLASLTVFGRRTDALRIANRVDGGASVFLVNIDVFDSLEQAVEELMALRACNANLPVVILSSEFGRDDCSLERQAVADASIRLPCTAERLATGLTCAVENAVLRQST